MKHFVQAKNLKELIIAVMDSKAEELAKKLARENENSPISDNSKISEISHFSKRTDFDGKFSFDHMTYGDEEGVIK